MRYKKTLKRLADYRLVHPDDTRTDDLVIAEMRRIAKAEYLAAYRDIPENKATAAEYGATYRAKLENKVATNKRMAAYRAIPENKVATNKRMAAYRAIPENKAAAAKRQAAYYAIPENKAAQANRMAAWYAIPENKAAVAKRDAAYYADPINKATRNARYRERYRTDIPYRLTVLTRSRIRHAFKSHAKDKHTIELLGCTGLFYQTFLEDQFTDGMTWENHGTLWHIDHIIPIDSFDKTDPDWQAQAFHYTNTQPLLAAHNLSKGSKLDWIKPSA